MDGNRRWAEAHGYDRHMGHKVGYEKMKQVLQWCMDIGCKVCTVFAFSIENFHRSPNEVQPPEHRFKCRILPLFHT
jgi:undecaprenyl diphosphate synthase